MLMKQLPLYSFFVFIFLLTFISSSLFLFKFSEWKIFNKLKYVSTPRVFIANYGHEERNIFPLLSLCLYVCRMTLNWFQFICAFHHLYLCVKKNCESEESKEKPQNDFISSSFFLHLECQPRIVWPEGAEIPFSLSFLVRRVDSLDTYTHKTFFFFNKAEDDEVEGRGKKLNEISIMKHYCKKKTRMLISLYVLRAESLSSGCIKVGKNFLNYNS